MEYSNALGLAYDSSCAAQCLATSNQYLPIVRTVGRRHRHSTALCIEYLPTRTVLEIIDTKVLVAERLQPWQHMQGAEEIEKNQARPDPCL